MVESRALAELPVCLSDANTERSLARSQRSRATTTEQSGPTEVPMANLAREARSLAFARSCGGPLCGRWRTSSGQRCDRVA